MRNLKGKAAQAVLAACAVLLFAPGIMRGQPDTLWTRCIYLGSHPMAMIQTADRGFAIGGDAWDGDPENRDHDWSILKLDSSGITEWREYYEFDNDTINIWSYVYSITQLLNGGYALTGMGLYAAGGIMRINEEGERLWATDYDIVGYDCSLDSDGNILIVDGFWPAALKVDGDDGEVIWLRDYAEEGAAKLWNITETIDGGFLLTGTSNSRIGEGSGDMYAIKIDNDGEIEWSNTFGTEYTDVVLHAVQTADGGYYLSGKLERDRSDFGMIVRTDSEGEEIWRRIYWDDMRNQAGGDFQVVVETPDGGFAVAPYRGSNSMQLFRMNSEGEILWDGRYSFPLPERGNRLQGYSLYSLILTDDLGYVLGLTDGKYWLIRTEPDSLSVAAWNLHVEDDSLDFGEVELDSTGRWDLNLTNEAEYPVHIQRVNIDSAVFTTDFEGILEIEAAREASIPVFFTPTETREYSTVLTVHTKFRNIIVNLAGTGVPLSAPDELVMPKDFALHPVYPNPFNSTVRVEYSISYDTEVKFSVYDIEGRLVQNLVAAIQDAGSYSVLWQADGVSTGTYILRFEAGGVVQSRKVALLK